MTHSTHLGVLGGTFDHLHLGHQHFIFTAINQVDRLLIGLTQTNLSPTKSYVHSIESFDTRLANLQTLLDEHHLLHKAEIIPIDDIYGPTLTNKLIKTIFVTDSTRHNAQIINDRRQLNGLAPLQIITIPYLSGDDQQIISSSRIRAGEIDFFGRSYSKFFLSHEASTLSSSLRKTLKQPLGIIFQDASKLISSILPDNYVISVGDVVTINLIKANFSPTLSLVDYSTRRKRLSDDLIVKYFPSIDAEISNPPGTINPQIADLLGSSLARYAATHKSQVIHVEGEEDLLALPAMLLAPLNSYVVYGQYEVGMCLVKITPEIKELAKHYLAKFNA